MSERGVVVLDVVFSKHGTIGTHVLKDIRGLLGVKPYPLQLEEEGPHRAGERPRDGQVHAWNVKVVDLTRPRYAALAKQETNRSHCYSILFRMIGAPLRGG